MHVDGEKKLGAEARSESRLEDERGRRSTGINRACEQRCSWISADILLPLLYSLRLVVPLIHLL